VTKLLLVNRQHLTRALYDALRRVAEFHMTSAVAAADPLPGQWPGLHYAMGRGFRKTGIRDHLRRWVLAQGTLPEGVHHVLWNKGENCIKRGDGPSKLRPLGSATARRSLHRAERRFKGYYGDTSR
jgi:hypothetical protein